MDLAPRDLIPTLNYASIEEAALRAIDPSLRFLFNVNTPDDLARLK